MNSEYWDYIEDRACDALGDIEYIKSAIDKNPEVFFNLLADGLSCGEFDGLTKHMTETLEGMIDEEVRENREMANAGCMY